MAPSAVLGTGRGNSAERTGWLTSCPYTLLAMSTQPTSDGRFGAHLEEPVDEVLRNARPYPPRDELLLDDLTDDEDAAFWETISAW